MPGRSSSTCRCSAPVYDENLQHIEGRFDDCAGNGCIARNQAPAASPCLNELNLSRGPGCATHAQGHGIEGLIRRNAIHCGGWPVYMRQNFSRYQNAARDTSKNPMKNWRPFLFF